MVSSGFSKQSIDPFAGSQDQADVFSFAHGASLGRDPPVMAQLTVFFFGSFHERHP